MLQILRDLPYADTIAPAILVGFLWCLAHIAYVGPHIVAPRVMEISYLPQCQARVAQFRTSHEHAIQTELDRRALLQSEAEKEWEAERQLILAQHLDAVRKAKELTQIAAAEAAERKKALQEKSTKALGNMFGQWLGTDVGRQITEETNAMVALLGELEPPAIDGAFEEPNIAIPLMPDLPVIPTFDFAPIPEFPVDDDHCGCLIRAAFTDPIETGLFSASLRVWQPAPIRELNKLPENLPRFPECGSIEIEEILQ